jgi:hypothetical protein
MFYQKTDPADNTAKLNVWFTDSGDFAACYSKASTALDLIASTKCSDMAHGGSIADSQAWKDCEDAQNSLVNTLGCSPHMFKQLDSDHFTQNQSQVTACQSNLSDVASLSLISSDGSSTASVKDITPTDSSTSTGRQLGCEWTFSNPLTFFICPVITILNGIVDSLDGLITNMLDVNSDQIFGGNSQTSEAYYKAWSSFRNISLGLMVLAGLVVLIAQALGLEILDAYTIRKVLPRILIAAIGITLSWPLMKFAIDFTNTLGLGIRHLIYAPFSALGGKIDLHFTHSIFSGGLDNFFFGASGFVLGTVGFGAALLGTALLIGVILSMAATAALAVFIAFMVLILRQVAIILLVLIAPVAIVSYILPNTSKLYNFWWDSFSKALLMFPLIAAFIATGRVFSAITLANNTDIVSKMIGFIAYFAPYFLIPVTFRFAGGFVRQLGGFVNDRSKGMFDRLRQRRARQMQGVGQNIKAGQATRIFGSSRPEMLKKFDRSLQRASMAGSAGVNPAHMLGRIRQARKAYDATKLDNIDKEDEMSLIRAYDNLGEVAELAGGNRGRMDDILRSRGVNDNQRKDMLDAWAIAQAGLSNKGYSEQAIVSGAGLINGLKAKTAHTEKGFDYAEDGTYMGGVRVLEAIARQSGNDTNTEASLIGRALEAQGAAGRQILPGFSSSLTALDKIKKINSDTTLSQKQKEAKLRDVANEMAETTIYKEGVSASLGKTAHDTRHLIPTYDRLLKNAFETYEGIKGTDKKARVRVYNSEKDEMEDKILDAAEAKDHLMSIAAQVAYMQQVNQSMPAEKQGQVSALLNETLGTREDGSTYTTQQFVDDSRGDPDMARHMFDIISQRERNARDAAGTIVAGSTPDIGSTPGGLPTSPA